jgi:hypothetical protein
MNILLYIFMGLAVLVFFGLLAWGFLSLIPHKFIPNWKGWKDWDSGRNNLTEKQKKEMQSLLELTKKLPKG